MNQSQENCQEEKGTIQNNTKMSYQTPQLIEYGAISEIIQHNPGTGWDGDFFPDCSSS